MKVPKDIQTIIDNNLKINRKIVDGYLLCVNKHIPRNGEVLDHKYEKLEKFFISKCNGQMDSSAIAYISGDNYCMEIIIRLRGCYKEILTGVRG